MTNPMIRIMRTLGMLTLMGAAVAATVVTPAPAYAQEAMAKHYPTFVLQYRKSNRWVAQEDKEGLDALSRYAKREGLYSFDIVLPEGNDTNVSIERLLVLSRILKSRLRCETIVFRQELGVTPPNTISVTPSDQGTATPQ